MWFALCVFFLALAQHQSSLGTPRYRDETIRTQHVLVSFYINYDSIGFMEYNAMSKIGIAAIETEFEVGNAQLRKRKTPTTRGMPP